MRSTCKGLPRYLEMLAKAHTEGKVPKDIRGFHRAKTGKLMLVKSSSEPTPKDTLMSRYVAAKIKAVGNALKVCDPTDRYKSVGNGL
jgi:hypothetical protein